MRYLYTVLLYLALPFILLRLWWRGRKLPAYRKRVAERLGFYPANLDSSIWVHAVSVGETIAAIPLIKKLKEQFPNIPLVVTTMTPTGAERVKSAFANSVIHYYLPYDFPEAVKRFLNAINPQVAIIMETELWPNLIAICQQKQIPICLLNARLSAKSAKGYKRIASLTKKMLQQLNIIAANGQQDAVRFIGLGASKNKIIVTGNIKFDLILPEDLVIKGELLRQQLGKKRFVWLAASTHEGEEEIILKAHEELRKQDTSALLVLVPRHPDRFNSVFDLANKQFKTKRRSLNEDCDDDTAVYLGDTMGELLLLYATVDVALVAGSLVPRGGHNILEPAALSKAIITGKHLFNFAEISQMFIEANALLRVKDANELANALLELKNNPELARQMGARALQIVEANRGALQKQLDAVYKFIRSS